MSERRRYFDVIISANSEILGGAYCFQGSRVPLTTALVRLCHGDTIETLAEEWPHIPREWLEWAELIVKEVQIHLQLVSAEPTDEFGPGD